MYRLERILCPVDFSPNSVEAVRFAHFCVKKFNGSLTLLYVDEFDATPPGFFLQDETEREERSDRIQEFAVSKFTEIIDSLKLDSARTTQIVRFGTAYKEIIDEAETNGYSAVMISTVGLGHSEPYLIGRTAERVVRLVRTPAFSLGFQESKKEFGISTILCPTDFSDYSNYALPYAISLARYFSAKLFMLHVSDINAKPEENILDKFPAIRQYHEGADSVEIDNLVDRDIEPENAIVRITRQYGIDLIVMGTHGARGMRRVQIGTTTEEVVRRVTVPVLTITHPIHKQIFPRRFWEDYQLENNWT